MDVSISCQATLWQSTYRVGIEHFDITKLNIPFLSIANFWHLLHILHIYCIYFMVVLDNVYSLLHIHFLMPKYALICFMYLYQNKNFIPATYSSFEKGLLFVWVLRLVLCAITQDMNLKQESNCNRSNCWELPSILFMFPRNNLEKHSMSSTYLIIITYFYLISIIYIIVNKDMITFSSSKL